MAARHKKNNIYKKLRFFVCEGLSIDGVGVSRDAVFQEIRLGAGFETSDFVEEKLGGLP